MPKRVPYVLSAVLPPALPPGPASSPLALTGAGVRVSAATAYRPRGTDRAGLDCTGSSPFTVTSTVYRALRSVTGVDAPGCRS